MARTRWYRRLDSGRRGIGAFASQVALDVPQFRLSDVTSTSFGRRIEAKTSKASGQSQPPNFRDTKPIWIGNVSIGCLLSVCDCVSLLYLSLTLSLSLIYHSLFLSHSLSLSLALSLRDFCPSQSLFQYHTIMMMTDAMLPFEPGELPLCNVRLRTLLCDPSGVPFTIQLLEAPKQMESPPTCPQPFMIQVVPREEENARLPTACAAENDADVLDSSTDANHAPSHPPTSSPGRKLRLLYSELSPSGKEKRVRKAITLLETELVASPASELNLLLRGIKDLQPRANKREVWKIEPETLGEILVKSFQSKKKASKLFAELAQTQDPPPSLRQQATLMNIPSSTYNSYLPHSSGANSALSPAERPRITPLENIAVESEDEKFLLECVKLNAPLQSPQLNFRCLRQGSFEDGHKQYVLDSIAKNRQPFEVDRFVKLLYDWAVHPMMHFDQHSCPNCTSE